MTVHHLEAFSFKLFSRDDTTEFLEYLKAKYYIFVKEENWSLPFNDETAAEDDYDTKGLFISCNKNEESAAIARGLISLDNIPYPELYKHHLHHIATHLWPNIASINTVGVKNKFRGLMPLYYSYMIFSLKKPV